MLRADKTGIIKELAGVQGFDEVGIAPADRVHHVPYLDRWLATGRAGSMEYLHRNHDIRTDPRHLLAGVRSVVVVAMNYHQQHPEPPGDGAPIGRVAMYAWGEDYHIVVKQRLHAMADEMHRLIDESFETRCCVDTVPILERELAAMAGIGWIGKNTMMLNQNLGSYFFLGEIVTTLELTPDHPVADHCGTCTRCLEACPTDALCAPYEMDASRCISYLTIEHREPIAEELQEGMGDWIFGCDICQQVCPYNQDAPNQDNPVTTNFSLRPPSPFVHLDDIANWSEQDYCSNLKDSAIKRAKLPMLQRNAAIARQNASAQ